MRFAKSLNGQLSDRGRDGSKNGRTGHRNGSNGHRMSATDRAVPRANHLPKCEFGDLLSELQNHHEVLDGILRPLYCGETPSLRPAEMRMLRYLSSEIGGLLAQLEHIDSKLPNCACRSQRAAV
jgi:hypothetical protein